MELLVLQDRIVPASGQTLETALVTGTNPQMIFDLHVETLKPGRYEPKPCLRTLHRNRIFRAALAPLSQATVRLT